MGTFHRVSITKNIGLRTYMCHNWGGMLAMCNPIVLWYAGEGEGEGEVNRNDRKMKGIIKKLEQHIPWESAHPNGILLADGFRYLGANFCAGCY